jgi:hypothetical protein
MRTLRVRANLFARVSTYARSGVLLCRSKTSRLGRNPTKRRPRSSHGTISNFSPETRSSLSGSMHHCQTGPTGHPHARPAGTCGESKSCGTSIVSNSRKRRSMQGGPAAPTWMNWPPLHQWSGRVLPRLARVHRVRCTGSRQPPTPADIGSPRYPSPNAGRAPVPHRQRDAC